MIDKKQLIEDLLECVNDATDTQTSMTGMTMCAMLMNEVIDQALILPDVNQQRELLKALRKNHIHNFGNTPITINELDDYIDSL